MPLTDRQRTRRRTFVLAFALAAVTLTLLARWAQQSAVEAPRSHAPGEAAVARTDDSQIVEAYRERRSGLVVESSGTVVRLLEDDDEGSRHQRFIVELDGGHTLLVSHNIDLAPRVPLAVGDLVAFRGQYEWNERGGVIHWTHHDPDGRRPGGWILRDGKRFR